MINKSRVAWHRIEMACALRGNRSSKLTRWSDLSTCGAGHFPSSSSSVPAAAASWSTCSSEAMNLEKGRRWSVSDHAWFGG